MASGTSIGSAQPILLTPGGIVYVNESKVLNAVSKLLGSYARLHSRSETAACLFVTENLNLGAPEALKYGVIEIIAEDVPDLLSQLDDKVLVSCRVGGELHMTLSRTARPGCAVLANFSGVSRARVVEVGEGPQIFLLKLLANPLVSTLLLIVGIYALMLRVRQILPYR